MRAPCKFKAKKSVDSISLIKLTRARLIGPDKTESNDMNLRSASILISPDMNIAVSLPASKSAMC